MAIQIQLRQGTTTEHNTFKGAIGEVTVDTTKDTLVVHDGVTVGGHPVATRANADGTISLIKKDGTSAGVVNSAGLFNNTLTSTNTNQALTAAQGKALKDTLDTAFGIGQTSKSKTLVSGTTYTNTINKPITLSVSMNGSSGMAASITVNNFLLFSTTSSNLYSCGFTVGVGESYNVTGINITAIEFS